MAARTLNDISTNEQQDSYAILPMQLNHIVGGEKQMRPRQGALGLLEITGNRLAHNLTPSRRIL